MRAVCERHVFEEVNKKLEMQKSLGVNQGYSIPDKQKLTFVVLFLRD